MEYLVVATTRTHVDLGEKKVAEAYSRLYDMIKERQKNGAVKYVGLSGPFTPMKTVIIIEAVNHEEAYKFITSLPAWNYMDNALYPLINLETAIDSVNALVERD